MVYKNNEVTDQNEWNRLVRVFADANFLHSFEWHRFHRKLGHPTRLRAYTAGKKPLGVMLATVESARRSTYLTVAGGPLFDWENQDLVNCWLRDVREIAVGQHCAFVRVRPQLTDGVKPRALFATLGFRKAPMHLHAELTNQLDLAPSETDLLASMRKSTRYEIRKAEKTGIRIKASSDPDDIDRFFRLQKETAVRQGFVPFSRDYLKLQFAEFAKTDSATLYSSFIDSQILAQAFIIFWGNEAVYHYGASTELGRKYPGAYAIQWEAIKEAKKRGLKRYNFWGVAPENQPEHRFAALSTFKRGFGGADIAYLPAHDLVLNPLLYAVNSAVETARSKVRRL